MPFKSKSQMRKFGQLVNEGKITKATFNEWYKATPKTQYLPERVKKTKDKISMAL